MNKQYDIKIIINGVVVMRKIIPADEGLRKQLYFSLREFGDWWVESESSENAEKEIDSMISKGVKKK